ncbi:MAG: dual specificity protein phosphatase family protein [Thermoplasmata archaeon]|nr:dual specificity protein phosphatase family protein [Thermoplasmata archaeon]
MSEPRKGQRTMRTKSESTPSEVAPGVFVGGWKDAAGFIGARFCVLDEEPEGMPPGTHIPIYDGEHDAPQLANLERVANLMHAARERNENVLVFCGHGVRRSPLAAAWYLHRYGALSLDGAYAKIRTVRPQVEEAKEWIENWHALETTPAPPGPKARRAA